MYIKKIKITYLAVLLCCAIACIQNSAFAESTKVYSNFYGPNNIPLKQTKVYNGQNEFLVDSHWLEVRQLFKNNVESIKWDNINKIAYVVNNGNELVFNFSGKDIVAKTNQYIVPPEYTKFENSTTRIDAYWLGYTFLVLPENHENADPKRDMERMKLNFVGIKETEFIVDVKGSAYHLFIKWR